MNALSEKTGTEETQLPKKARPSQARKDHKKTYGFKGRKNFTNTVPIFRPIVSTEAPARAAKRYAEKLLWASLVWFGVSCAGFIYNKGMHPLPPGEDGNVLTISDNPYMAKWFVNMLMSVAFAFVMFIQFVFLRLYTLDRTLRKARALHWKRDVVILGPDGKVQGDTDDWDLEEFGLAGRSAPVSGSDRMAGMFGGGRFAAHRAPASEGFSAPTGRHNRPPAYGAPSFEGVSKTPAAYTPASLRQQEKPELPPRTLNSATTGGLGASTLAEKVALQAARATAHGT